MCSGPVETPVVEKREMIEPELARSVRSQGREIGKRPAQVGTCLEMIDQARERHRRTMDFSVGSIGKCVRRWPIWPISSLCILRSAVLTYFFNIFGLDLSKAYRAFDDPPPPLSP